MDVTKIRLSKKEISLVSDARVILTKNEILEKTKILLGHLQSKYREALIQSELPAELIQSPPKISRGEKYKGLPWMMLDYPRRFGKENAFAIRTMFWWGNFFSITLHLSGNYKKQYEDKLVASYKRLRKNDFYICMNKDPWEHHFEKGNFIAVDKLSSKEFEEAIRNKNTVKLSNKTAISKWDNSGKFLFRNFRILIDAL